MFEKEAEEYGIENYESCMYDDVKGWETDIKAREQGFKDGAEFGYNKANEWHYVRDGDLPKENKLYFVAIKDNGLAIAYFNGQYWETKFNLGDFGHCVETVIAWCEIPKYTEE